MVLLVREVCVRRWNGSCCVCCSVVRLEGWSRGMVGRASCSKPHVRRTSSEVVKCLENWWQGLRVGQINTTIKAAPYPLLYRFLALDHWGSKEVFARCFVCHPQLGQRQSHCLWRWFMWSCMLTSCGWGGRQGTECSALSCAITCIKWAPVVGGVIPVPWGVGHVSTSNKWMCWLPTLSRTQLLVHPHPPPPHPGVFLRTIRYAVLCRRSR